jgi:hypothetical protein
MRDIVKNNAGLDVSKEKLTDSLNKVCLTGNYAFAPNSQGVAFVPTKKFSAGTLLDGPGGMNVADGYIRKWRVRQPTPEQMVDCYQEYCKYPKKETEDEKKMRHKYEKALIEKDKKDFKIKKREQKLGDNSALGKMPTIKTSQTPGPKSKISDLSV